MIDTELEALRRRHGLAPEDESLAIPLVDALVRRGELDLAADTARTTCSSREQGGRPPATALLARLTSLPGRALRDWSVLATLPQRLDNTDGTGSDAARVGLDGGPTAPRAGDGVRINGVAWADGRTLLVARVDGSISRLDLGASAARPLRPPSVSSARRGPQLETRLVAGGLDAVGFRIPPGSFAARWARDEVEVELSGALCIAPDHRGGFLAGTLDGTVVEVRPRDSGLDRRIHRIDGGDSIWAIARTEDGRFVVTTEMGGLTVYDDLRTRHRVHETPSGELMRSNVRLANDGASAAWLVASDSGTRVHRYVWRDEAWTSLNLGLHRPAGWSADDGQDVAAAWSGGEVVVVALGDAPPRGSHPSPPNPAIHETSVSAGTHDGSPEAGRIAIDGPPVRRVDVAPGGRLAIVLTVAGALRVIG